MTSTNERSRIDSGSTLAIGVSLGLIFGLLLDNIAMGLVTGLALATFANAYHEKKQNKPLASIALSISAGAVVIVALLWVLAALGIL